eukprot:jgi/Ulvmu1/4559/UM002_0287.1
MTGTAPVAAKNKYTGKVQYIIGYNLICFVGWSACLAITWNHLVQRSSTRKLYDDVMLAVKITQSLAVLEVVHAAVGLVRSPVFTTAQQVASRIFIVWGILAATPDAVKFGSIALFRLGGISFGLDLFSLMLAWSVTEVIRYSFYALKEVGSAPAFLTWLRYTTFIVLYPIGVSSELAMVWLALPELRRTKLWSLEMPNQFNMVFNYEIFCILAMLAYAPGFPPLYMYMFKQRKKVLSTPRIKQS